MTSNVQIHTPHPAFAFFFCLTLGLYLICGQFTAGITLLAICVVYFLASLAHFGKK